MEHRFLFRDKNYLDVGPNITHTLKIRFPIIQRDRT